MKGCSAAVYAVVHQREKTTQGLVTSKSRIAKPNVSIPRLELIAGHMVANLTDNVRRALAGTTSLVLTDGWTAQWLSIGLRIKTVNGNSSCPTELQKYNRKS